MATTPEYDALLAEVTDAFERRVLNVLLSKPQGITRQDFVMTLFGYFPDNLANNKHDRMIREAIENLRGSWPICSSSGKAGYKLTEDQKEINDYAEEQASRAARETEKARQAHNWPTRIHAIREYRQTHVKVEQPGLF